MRAGPRGAGRTSVTRPPCFSMIARASSPACSSMIARTLAWPGRVPGRPIGLTRPASSSEARRGAGSSCTRAQSAAVADVQCRRRRTGRSTRGPAGVDGRGRDDAGGAVGVDVRECFLAAYGEGLGVRCAGHDRQLPDKTVPVGPVDERARAAVATGEEAAEGCPEGGGEHPQLLAQRAGVSFEVGHLRPGLGPDPPVAGVQDAAASGEVEHGAVVQRDRLAVVAGALAARGERDAEVVGEGQDARELLVRGGAEHGLGVTGGELGGQDGRHVRPVAGRLLEGGRIADDPILAEHFGSLVQNSSMPGVGCTAPSTYIASSATSSVSASCGAGSALGRRPSLHSDRGVDECVGRHVLGGQPGRTLTPLC